MLDAGALTGAALAAVAGLPIRWRQARLRAHQAPPLRMRALKNGIQIGAADVSTFRARRRGTRGQFHSSNGSLGLRLVADRPPHRIQVGYLPLCLDRWGCLGILPLREGGTA